MNKDNYLALAIIVLAICVGIALYSNAEEPETSQPVSGASAEGLWHQTAAKGYYNGSMITNTYASNDLTIREYKDYTEDPQHFLTCSQRGYDFLAFRAGDRIMWSYEGESGSFTSISTCYGDCIIVNEIFLASSSTAQTYVSSSIYTKDNIIPSYLSNWDYKIPNQKWSLHDGGAVSDTETTSLSGNNLYILENSGPIFKGEMEQSVGTTISTKKLVGVVIDYVPGTYLLALALDDTDILWSMTYNGSTVTMSTVAVSDSAVIGGLVSGQRNYIQMYDASLPTVEKPILTEGTEMEVIGTTVFTSDGVQTLPVSGKVTIENCYGTAYYAPGVFSGTQGAYEVKLFGFTMPTVVSNEYLVYCVFQGLIDGRIPIQGGGYGSYDSDKGYLKFAIMTSAAGMDVIMEILYRNATSSET